MSIIPLREVFVGDVRALLLVLASGGVLLQLIGFINVSTLLLVRAHRRTQEVALRSALGASSARVAHQFAVEAVVLVALSGTLGLVLTRGLMVFLSTLIPPDMMASMPYLHGLDFNARVLALGTTIGVLAVFLFTLVPTTRVLVSGTREALKEGGRSVVGKTWRTVSATLVTTELAIAVTLLVSAGLLGQSLYRLLQVEVGFATDGLASVEVDLPATYATPKQVVPLKRQIMERVAIMPGVRRVAIADQLPLASWAGTTAAFEIEGRPPDGKLHEASSRR